MLYAPESHAPLTATPWDETRLRDGIRAIVAAADGAYDAQAMWPAHDCSPERS